MASAAKSRPIVGITSDIAAEAYSSGRAYSRMIAQAGGTPIILPCILDCVHDYLDHCHAIILSGGGDPNMAAWGQPTHPKANPIHPDRQTFELAILDALAAEPDKPALGICLGMQMMGLHAGAELNQHLPDTLETAAKHIGRQEHEIAGELGRGRVYSHHRQALTTPGLMSVVAIAPDGVIEAIQDRDRPFYLGVQWHPERTSDPKLGLGLLSRLVEAARRAPVRA